MNTEPRVIIIGGVACGPKTASRLKRVLPGADITLIEKGDITSYGACGIPYYVEGVFRHVNELVNTSLGVARDADYFDKVKGFKVLTGMEAVRIDPEEKTVAARNAKTGGEEKFAYDKLVLATGGYPFRPPIPGVDLKNVWFMVHPTDAESLVRQIKAQGPRRAVLVGAGFIGIEMAEALKRRGLDVTMVEMADQIMPGILDPDIAALGANHIRENGVELIFGERVIGIEGEDRATAVRTEQRQIPADVVVIGVGTRPNDTLAREAGLKCENGILINEFCQTSDPDIYAGGDCVVNQYAGGGAGGKLFVALGSTANKHGRTIANHIAGIATPFRGITGSSIVRAFAYNIGRTGITEQQARARGLDMETIMWAGGDLPHYMPENKLVIIKMIADRRTRKVLGLQVAGPGNGAKRLDVAAAAILFGGTIDQVAAIDFGYAPPFSPPLDPLATCAHVLGNKLDKIAVCLPAAEAKRRIEQGNLLLLDVRTAKELKKTQIPYDFVHIPLDELRRRMGELPRDKDILIFCQVSLRGYEAQRMVSGAGFDRVWFIEGGLATWPYGIRKPA